MSASWARIVRSDLLIYCLIAMAPLELSANIRLQFGPSDEGTLDLYRYNTRMPDIIASRDD